MGANALFSGGDIEHSCGTVKPESGAFAPFRAFHSAQTLTFAGRKNERKRMAHPQEAN